MRELSARFDQWRKRWARVSSGALGLRQALERKGDSEVQAGTPLVSFALAEFLDWNSDYLRSMESKLLSLSVQAERDRHAVAKHVDDLLDESKKLRMLPFSTVSGVFPKLIRDLCRDQNKEADVTINGNETEIDKRILEEMKDALIHVLRNCVDHGVESPAERTAHNKPPRATIQITVSPVDGSKVEILVSDDGAGVDIERVKQSAIRLGIISQSDARTMSERDALALVFHSEVSTTQAVTAISGRGLGMAIVRRKNRKARRPRHDRQQASRRYDVADTVAAETGDISRGRCFGRRLRLRPADAKRRACAPSQARRYSDHRESRIDFVGGAGGVAGAAGCGP